MYVINQRPAILHIAGLMACIWTGGQNLQAQCAAPLCVNRADDRVNEPLPGMLRYAVREAPPGSVITFDPALNGQTIRLDQRSSKNPLRISRDLTLQGPGAGQLAISGGHATRLFVITGGNVRIAGLTLTEGFARGNAGNHGAGCAGGGGGGAGMGGAIFMVQGALTLEGVVLRGNQVVGGDGGSAGPVPSAGRGGSGGAWDLGDEAGGAGGSSEAATLGGTLGVWGAGGGGGGSNGTSGGPGSGSVFGGGVGGAAGFQSEAVNVAGTSGGGGAGLGGALFVRSGLLQMIDTTFTDNTATGGAGGSGAPAGPGKAGAVFICSPGVCGSGADAAAIWSGKLTLRNNEAADPGGEFSLCPRDDRDVCGNLSSPVPTHLSVLAPVSIGVGESFPVTVSALDAGNNLVATYTGKVHLVSSDPNAAMPPDAELSNGQGVFTVTLNSAGPQRVSGAITTAAAIGGASNPITVTKE